MTTFATLADYLNACTERETNSHKPPATPYFRTCEQCGKQCAHTDGMAIKKGSHQICYSCCHVDDLEQLKDRTKPFYCYLSCDGKTVSNWPGAELGTVHTYTESRAGWNRGTIARFRVKDAHGQWWHARGSGAGMVCTMRPLKTA